MRDVVELLSSTGQLPRRRRLRGVPAAELDAWERDLGRPLPADYRSFMELAGATPDARLFHGSRFFWPTPVEMQHEARASIETHDRTKIPSGALFILDHDGYAFAWIDQDEPATPVWVLQPADIATVETTRAASCFREWLHSIAGETAALRDW